MTVLRMIMPYKSNGVWVFDDESKGLSRTPFLSGIPYMIEALVADLPNAQQGFKLLFSPSPFPGYQAALHWIGEEHGGNWYEWPERRLQGWLSPPLYAYFNTPPRRLYCRAEPLEEGAPS